MQPAATRALTREHVSYPKRAGASATGNASPAQVFATVCTIGGDDGWFFADYLWWLRRVLDWLVGGPSFRRRRRHPTELRLGDVVDSWRVIGLEPDRRLTLSMEMKAPGTGVLEFVITPTVDGGASVSATAYWQPSGVAGWIYWYVLVPAHLFIFDGLTRAIQRRTAGRRQH